MPRTGPKGGKKLTGPISLNSTVIHPCYTDFILANIAKSEYLDRISLPMEQRLALWHQEYPHTCRSSCPGTQNLRDLHEQDLDNNSDDDSDFTTPASIISIATEQERQLRPRLTIPPSAATTSGSGTILSPIFSDILDENFGAEPALFPNFIDNSSPSQPRRLPLPLASGPTQRNTPQSPTPGFVLPITPETRESTPYLAPITARYKEFSEFENFVRECCQTIGNSFRVRAENVSKAAKGLMEAIKSVNRSHVTIFVDNGNSVISPAGLSLSQIFSCSNWIFFAYVHFYIFIMH